MGAKVACLDHNFPLWGMGLGVQDVVNSKGDWTFVALARACFVATRGCLYKPFDSRTQLPGWRKL